MRKYINGTRCIGKDIHMIVEIQMHMKREIDGYE